MPKRILSAVALALGAGAAVPGAAAADAIPPYTTVMVSRQSDSAGGAGGDDESRGATVRARGRLVFFGSSASNLTPEGELNDLIEGLSARGIRISSWWTIAVRIARAQNVK